MIGSRTRDETNRNVYKAPQSAYGAGALYGVGGSSGWQYATRNGAERSQPVLHSSNKSSEHNIFNMPLTPGLVVKILPVQKFSRQSFKIRSLPVKLPWNQ